ncbi:hypothetical protein AB837_00480 [bacterium AB1]|nr:hypothetical protein AB837_00480 [bacterium AB1]
MYQTLKDENNNLKDQLKLQFNQLIKVQSELNYYQNKCSALDRQMDQMDKDCQKYQKENSDLIREKKILKMHASDTDAANKAKEYKISLLKRGLKKNGYKSNDNATLTLSPLPKKLPTNNKKKDDSQEKISELQKQVNFLQQLDRQNDEKTNMLQHQHKQKTRDFNEKINILNSEINNLNAQYQNCKKENQNLANTMNREIEKCQTCFYQEKQKKEILMIILFGFLFFLFVLVIKQYLFKKSEKKSQEKQKHHIIK